MFGVAAVAVVVLLKLNEAYIPSKMSELRLDSSELYEFAISGNRNAIAGHRTSIDCGSWNLVVMSSVNLFDSSMTTQTTSVVDH